MSNNRLTFRGLDALRAELRRLPDELATQAGRIVEGAANGGAADAARGYPRRTGDLGSKVQVRHQRTAFGARSVVTNTSKHALPFEVGTQARHTALGANRGAMPPGNVFLPAMRRARRHMYSELADLLRRHGLKVSGA